MQSEGLVETNIDRSPTDKLRMVALRAGSKRCFPDYALLTMDILHGKSCMLDFGLSTITSYSFSAILKLSIVSSQVTSLGVEASLPSARTRSWTPFQVEKLQLCNGTSKLAAPIRSGQAQLNSENADLLP